MLGGAPKTPNAGGLLSDSTPFLAPENGEALLNSVEPPNAGGGVLAGVPKRLGAVPGPPEGVPKELPNAPLLLFSPVFCPPNLSPEDVGAFPESGKPGVEDRLEVPVKLLLDMASLIGVLKGMSAVGKGLVMGLLFVLLAVGSLYGSDKVEEAA